jgi:hypothetical protein
VFGVVIHSLDANVVYFSRFFSEFEQINIIDEKKLNVNEDNNGSGIDNDEDDKGLFCFCCLCEIKN